MRTQITAAALAAIALASAPAFGETALPQSGNDQASGQQSAISSLRQAGYTDVQAATGSVLIQAKDKSGNPVMLIVNGAQGRMTVGASAGSTTQTAHATATPGGAFTAVPAKDSLGSKVIGLEVYNNNKQNIGTIKDVAFNENGVDGYILSVGGFLGIGDHYVAVRPSAVKISYDRGDNRWHASMDATADQLKAAQEFKYPSNT
ncbi:PRC-barrel domain-containing protein [Bradyrhizobium betae]|uniref:PRC-barrel domain-containing protein n=1 Tax=Bradyrhizobium betae TaxID=244734 RepID=UPI003D66845F